jgi:hypothetical protein
MFRPSFEALEKREVFSVAQPLDQIAGVYVEEASPGFDSHTRPANDGILQASNGGNYSFAIGPNVADVVAPNATLGRGVAADFDADGDVDGADFLTARDSATGQISGLKPTLETTPLADTRLVDDLIGWDIRSPTSDNDETTFRAADARDAAFADLGPRGILLDPEARGNIVDGTSNTIIFSEARTALSRASVTDLVIDPFNSNALIGTDGGVWRIAMPFDRG